MQSNAQSSSSYHPHSGNPYNHSHIKVSEKVVHQEEYYSEIYCSCNSCGKKFKIIEDPGYHYPVYHWNLIE